MKIKLISFDLWGTLIKGNPQYSVERNKIIKKYSDNKNITDEFISGIFAEVKADFNVVVEKYGVHVDRITIYNAIFSKLFIMKHLWQSIIKDLDKAFVKNPPSLYNDNTISILNEIKKEKIDLMLISNTLLISGKVLEKALPFLTEIFESNTYFSDEFELSKPNSNIFAWCYVMKNYNKKEILHVGDNPICDIKGGNEFGINTLQINTNELTILDVLIKLYNK